MAGAVGRRARATTSSVSGARALGRRRHARRRTSRICCTGRARRRSSRDAAWTDADVALIDEADALLGPVEARPAPRRAAAAATPRPSRPRRASSRSSASAARPTRADARRALRRRRRDGETDEIPELRTFGHVLVDEAQDLTAMQWRMLARRCPSGSMTLVGDPARRAGPARARRLGRRARAPAPATTRPASSTLTVNYRTPAEIMDVANRLLAAAAPDRRAVAVGAQHRRVAQFARGRRRRRGREAAGDRDAGARRGGTVAVIAPAALHTGVGRTSSPTSARRPIRRLDALDAPIAVLDATDAKGLEFDHVVVVEPAPLVTPDRAGLRLLYVTITRATRRLTVVHSEPLPEAWGSRP